jgi:hypothetical protein
MSTITEMKAPIKIADLTPDHIIPEKLEENERSNNQLMGYVRDPDNDQVMIQTCTIPISDFGVPSYHKSYYDTFDKRAHCKLPLDVKQNPSIQKMIDAMVAIDEKFNSSETRKILFGSDDQEWQYQEIVRESEPGKDGRERPPYMKIKLDTVYDSESIKTLLIDTNGQVIKAASAASLEDEQLYTIDEFCSYVKFRSKIMLVITPCKVWTIARGVGKNKVKNYGITWKAKQIMVSPPQYAKAKLTRSIFVQDDEEDTIMSGSSMVDTITASMGSLITPDAINTLDDTKMVSSSASEDIGDSSDDDDEDDVAIKKPVKKATKKKGKTKGL